MGFYIRKSFGLGPVRLNLSKRGVGTSVGVKGARISQGADGKTRVHAGRGGAYYRASLPASRQKPVQSRHDWSAAIAACIVVGLAFCFFSLLFWTSDASCGMVAMALSLFILIGLPLIINAKLSREKKALAEWERQEFEEARRRRLEDERIEKERLETEERLKAEQKASLDQYRELVKSLDELPDEQTANQLVSLRSQVMAINEKMPALLRDLEDSLAAAWLTTRQRSKALTPTELREFIDTLGHRLKWSESQLLGLRKKIFVATFWASIEDQELDLEEETFLDGLRHVLEIPESEVASELDVARQFAMLRILKEKGFPPVSAPAALLGKSEQARYHATGSLQEDRANFETETVLEGDIYVTDKKISIVGDGHRDIKLRDILDIEIEDSGYRRIELVKKGRKKPFYIDTQDQHLMGAVIYELQQRGSKG